MVQYIDMKIGYARVSTDEQSLDLQVKALEEYGCEKIFEDLGVSGSMTERPGLEKMYEAMKSNDTIVVWRLDRLGRSLTHLISIIEDLGKQCIEFTSLTEEINTGTAGGRLIFHIMGALAEFERSLIVERTKAGIAVARSRGVHLGRPKKLTEYQVSHAESQIQNGASLNATAALLGVNRSTLRRAIKRL